MMVLSLVLNAVYYKLHPMRLPLSPKGKLQTHICGVLTCTCYAEPEEDVDEVDEVPFGKVVDG